MRRQNLCEALINLDYGEANDQERAKNLNSNWICCRLCGRGIRIRVERFEIERFVCDDNFKHPGIALSAGVTRSPASV